MLMRGPSETPGTGSTKAVASPSVDRKPSPKITRSRDMTTKRRTSPTTLVAGMLLVLLAGCSEPKDQVKPESLGSSNTPGLTNEEPPGETGWSCPKNTLGAKMVLIPVDEGNPYCIDEREAVYGEYKEFLAAKGGDFADQPPQCRWNDDYGPASVVDQSSSCADCGPIVYGPAIDDADPDRAVQGLDFCDAWAFCSWAGKRLCGLRGAASDKVATVHQPEDPELANQVFGDATGSTRSEWFNVCTQAGSTKYPYGDERKLGICINNTKLATEGSSALSVRDSADSKYHGTIPPV